ncbi:MAG: hypothetical protein J5531_02820 [Lachnospiraceae bacterium]|nr:hypothetical protein [Lachnospiraceae bacterium]
MDFEADGVRYRITRVFGETPRFDTTKIINLDKGITAKIDPDKIGETLFHLDANAFQRSVFINQNGLTIDGAASSIHTRLNTLVSQANDVAAYDSAISGLTQKIKVYEKTGARGQLGDITRQIAAKERSRAQLESDIALQDAARERIAQIDVQLKELNRELEEKNKQLDDISGETKRREASQKLLGDIDNQIAELQKSIEAITADLGGSVPTAEEIERTKQYAQSLSGMKLQVGSLEAEHAKLTGQYNAIVEKYGGTLPTTAQLDYIQSTFSELQGVTSAGEGVSVSEETAPEEYKTIKDGVSADPEFLSRLQITVGLQTCFQELLRQLETQEHEFEREADTWRETQRRYVSLKDEVAQKRAAVKEKESYGPAITEPLIEKLEALQKREQATEIKKESLLNSALTADQEALLRDYPGDLPDPQEGNEILQKQRDVVRQQSEIQGLSARLDGERSKADSLATSIEQLGPISASDTAEPKLPKSSCGSILIVLGIIAVIAGGVLGIFVMPALYAVAVVGVVLIIAGIVSNSGYKKRLQEYAERQSIVAKNKVTARKREELLEQQKKAKSSVTLQEMQLSEKKKKLKADEDTVSAWVTCWGADSDTPSDVTITRILEDAETVRKLREIQSKNTFEEESLKTECKAINTERESVDTVCPACSGKSIVDALRLLRENQNDYNIADDQYRTAVQKEKQFLEETGITREELALADSPKSAALKAAKEETAAALSEKLAESNDVLAVLGLKADQEHIITVLHLAEEKLNEYKRFAEKIDDQRRRTSARQQQVGELQSKLNEALAPISSVYPELDIAARLTSIREETEKAVRMGAKIREQEAQLEQRRKEFKTAQEAVSAFSNQYGHFPAEKDAALSEIYAKAKKYGELQVSQRQLNQQKEDIIEKNGGANASSNTPLEAELRGEVVKLQTQRDELLIEFTQQGDFIRQADQSLEKYPKLLLEIRDLYEQKQKAQNTLAILKRSIQLITKAKENLANRYLSKVEELFNGYMRIWLNSDAIKGILDLDFNISIEENGKTHVAEGYSTGYCDLIDFCMRLALVDTLFENEQPFLIMDDPFVNLDPDRLEKALELLSVMAANKQVVYFICHPIRAVETEENAASREEFLKLAEVTKKLLTERQATGTGSRTVAKKSPKELYRLVNITATLPFKPANPTYTITNTIFSLYFEPIDTLMQKDCSYELFFIDAVGHVLNERKILEVSNGKLSVDHIQFSLNTRDDSGDMFELMVRESGQDDYDVVARIPFRAKLAFAGTFNFGF